MAFGMSPFPLRFGSRQGGGSRFGPELSPDVEFDTPGLWTPQNEDWEVADGKATFSGTTTVYYLQSDASMAVEAGKQYLAAFTISGATEGGDAVILSLFNITSSENLFDSYQTYTTNGDKEVLFTPSGNSNGVRIYGNGANNSPSWSLERFSLREVFF